MEKIINWVNKPFAAYPDVTERIVYLLIFLFPIAGMSVKHWITTIFNILALIALFTLKKPREPLLKQEKIFLWICTAYFSMFIISSLANGWEKAQTYYLGTELRFLLVIPLYLLLRRYPDCSKWLLHGAILGGFFLFGQAYYDVYIMGHSTALGIYSKNIIGPIAVLISFWSLYYVWQNYRDLNKQALIFILLSVIAAFATVSLSGSRGAYFGFIVTSIASVLFMSKPRWMFVSLAAISLTAILIYQTSNTVEQGVNTAKNELQEYLQAKDHTNPEESSSNTSIGVRLEMMRTGSLFIRDNFLSGIGPGNYHKSIVEYIKDGKANPALAGYAHPHNVFMEVTTGKGLVGLLTVLLLFYYPAFIFIKGYKENKPTAVLGLIHIVAISAFSLTDHSVVVMNNYTSLLLLGMTIFLSSHIRRIS